jgi:hypothetical protein
MRRLTILAVVLAVIGLIILLPLLLLTLSAPAQAAPRAGGLRIIGSHCTGPGVDALHIVTSGPVDIVIHWDNVKACGTPA